MGSDPLGDLALGDRTATPYLANNQIKTIILKPCCNTLGDIKCYLVQKDNYDGFVETADLDCGKDQSSPSHD